MTSVTAKVFSGLEPRTLSKFKAHETAGNGAHEDLHVDAELERRLRYVFHTETSSRDLCFVRLTVEEF